MQQTTSEITYIVAYRCPNCQAALEARTSEAQTWLRCPKCGRASLPPEFTRTPRVEPILPGDDVLVIGPSADAGSQESGDLGPYRAYPGAIRRVVLAVLILGSLTSLVTAFLAGNYVNVAIYGVATIVLLVITGFTARRR